MFDKKFNRKWIIISKAIITVYVIYYPPQIKKAKIDIINFFTNKIK